MITRREFSGGAAAATVGLLAVPHVARAQARPVIRIGNASGIIDAQLIFQTVGEHPRVGYFAQEGVGEEILNMSGVGQTLQAVTTGAAEASAVSPVPFLQVYVKNPNLDLIYPYIWLRQPHWSVVVKPDSPIKTLAELKGKTVGIRNQGDTGYIGARAMLSELGMNPDRDLEWVSVGEGGPAGEAIHRGRVDAMAYWDGGIARIENAGFQLRHLPNSPGMQHLFGNGYAVQKSALEKNPDVYVRFFRALAKSTVFASANPELSIRLHWEVYPETKPKGKSDEESMKEQLHIVNSRKDKWMPAAWQADKRMGAQTREEWEAQVKFAGLEGQIKDVTKLFTNDYLDAINKFDRAAIEKQAREMTM